MLPRAVTFVFFKPVSGIFFCQSLHLIVARNFGHDGSGADDFFFLVAFDYRLLVGIFLRRPQETVQQNLKSAGILKKVFGAFKTQTNGRLKTFDDSAFVNILGVCHCVRIKQQALFFQFFYFFKKFRSSLRT